MADRGGRTHRRWCFTLNNYTDDEYAAVCRGLAVPGVRYAVVGKEVGESGTPHLQGYLECANSMRIGGVKRILGTDRCHLEPARGDGRQASEYCKKEGSFVEFGRLGGGQGNRTDLAAVKELLDARVSMLDVAQAHFGAYCRYRRSFEAYAALLCPKRAWRTQLIWYWGASGTGKSRLAHEESQALCGGDVAWMADVTLAWYNPYAGHKGIVIDDLDGRAPITELLRMCDRYNCQVPIKGGFVEFSARIVWITSNRSPLELYGHCGENYEGLRRRIDDLREF